MQMLCRICCNLPRKAEPKSYISASLFMLLPRFNAALTELSLASKSVFVQVMVRIYQDKLAKESTHWQKRT